MTQGERIIEDAYEALRFYEAGHFDKAGVIKCLHNLTAMNCENCIYNNDECGDDHEKTCAEGWNKYLESEAE